MGNAMTTEEKVDVLIDSFKTNISRDDEWSEFFNKALSLITSEEPVEMYTGLKAIVECGQLMIEGMEETYGFSDEDVEREWFASDEEE